jgi:hypothetical protein
MCRPRLEALEDRNVMNVSVAFSAAGDMTVVAVYDNGAMVSYDSAGAHLLADSGIRVAHLFRDPSGQVGLDVVSAAGAAVEYDSTGAHVLATSGVLDLSRAYRADGDFKLEVLYNDGSGLTGRLVEYTPTSVTLLNTAAYFATAYIDAAGQFGLAIGTVDAVANALVSAADSRGTTTLYNGSFVITQCLGDYDEAFDLAGRVFVDVVFNPGNAGGGSLGSPHTGREFGPEGAVGLGLNVMAH